MIIVRLKSGLGNQLFQYAMGLSLSRKKNTPLLFDSSLFKQGNRILRLNYFNLNYNSISKFTLWFLSSNFVYSISRLFQSNFYHKVIRDPIWRPLELSGSGNLILIGYWSFNRYFEEIRGELVAKCTVKEIFFNISYVTFKERILGTEAVAIHIRRGDYVSDREYNSIFGVLPIQYYIDAIEEIRRKVGNPYFFVFSDDPDWVNGYFSIDQAYTLVSDVESLEDYHEFDLMRCCKHQIISNSTFSWWAAYLNDYEHRVIIQPQRWYQSETAQSVYESNEFLFIKGAIRI
ncbi:Glycosyl transferase family 11 [Cyclobacterium xiamenense]|uniref:Glycosyl transferase family 11 n=2 Tax=Cyclobacterium xiamenense TaxID=1297121 RepID=A0A1H7AA23_9BACT|nr:Glycosyl transferase family 11 [Cyclobacterium xiamenense]